MLIFDLKKSPQILRSVAFFFFSLAERSKQKSWNLCTSDCYFIPWYQHVAALCQWCALILGTWEAKVLSTLASG